MQTLIFNTLFQNFVKTLSRDYQYCLLFLQTNSSDDNSVASSIPDPATSFAFDRQWLSTRKAIAAADGRPFVIEEFGAQTASCRGNASPLRPNMPLVM